MPGYPARSGPSARLRDRFAALLSFGCAHGREGPLRGIARRRLLAAAARVMVAAGTNDGRILLSAFTRAARETPRAREASGAYRYFKRGRAASDAKIFGAVRDDSEKRRILTVAVHVWVLAGMDSLEATNAVESIAGAMGLGSDEICIALDAARAPVDRLRDAREVSLGVVMRARVLSRRALGMRTPVA